MMRWLAEKLWRNPPPQTSRAQNNLSPLSRSAE
jgi:hypothetical protein